MENKVCKNKKCMKFLPAGYKHRYCEACRNRQAQKLKNGLKLLVLLQLVLRLQLLLLEE